MRLAENRVSVALPRGDEAEEEASGGDDESDASGRRRYRHRRRRRGGERGSIPIPTTPRVDAAAGKNKGGTRNGSRHRLVAVSLDLSLSAPPTRVFTRPSQGARRSFVDGARQRARAVDAALARRGAWTSRTRAAGEGADAGPRRRGREARAQWFEKFHWFVTPGSASSSPRGPPRRRTRSCSSTWARTTRTCTPTSGGATDSQGADDVLCEGEQGVRGEV